MVEDKKICKRLESSSKHLQTSSSIEIVKGKDLSVNDKKVITSFLEASGFGDLHLLSEKLSAVYSYLGYSSKGKKLYYCGSYLELLKNKHDSSDIKLKKANFCKDRLCPQCSKRRSLKIYGQLSNILDHFPSGYAFLLVTLTIRNVAFNSLQEGIDSLLSGWRKLMHSKYGKDFQRLCKGSFRTLEITFNPSTGMWHPHLHVIVAVSSSYFKHDSYLTTYKLSSIWRDCCGLDYDPVVDMRRVNIGDSGGINEVSKYCVKSNDLLVDDFNESCKRVEVLYRALRRRRLCGMTGIFKSLHHDLNLCDPEDDIDSDLPANVNDFTDYILVCMHWGAGAYHFDIDK